MAKVRKIPGYVADAEVGGNYVHHPAPALVRVKCKAADLEYVSKTSGNEGMHLEFEIVGSKPPKKGQQWQTLHQYVTYAEEMGFREAEVLDALVGKRTGTYSVKDLVGKVCLARLRPEDYEGEMTAKISRLIPLDDEAENDDDFDVDRDEDEGEDDDESETDDEMGYEEEPGDDYADWSLTQLRAELDDRGLDSKGQTRTLIRRLEENDADGGDNADGEDEPEDDDAEDFTTMSLRELRVIAKDRGIATRGLDKDALVEALAESADEEDDEEADESDETEDDEDAANYSEWSLRDLRSEAKERGIETRGLDKAALVEALEEDDDDPLGGDDE